jgi:hypothetical protein
MKSSIEMSMVNGVEFHVETQKTSQFELDPAMSQTTIFFYWLRTLDE